jgi:hypothetical protein
VSVDIKLKKPGIVSHENGLIDFDAFAYQCAKGIGYRTGYDITGKIIASYSLPYMNFRRLLFTGCERSSIFVIIFIF